MKKDKKLAGILITACLVGIVFVARAAIPRKPPMTVDPSKIQGRSDAPLTLFVFTDFVCPFSEEMLPHWKKTVDENAQKLRIVYKHYSARYAGEPRHRRVAEAAECAGEQGRFLDFQAYLFERVEKFFSAKDHAPIMKIYARDMGLDAARFDECLDSRRYKDVIERDMNEAARMMVNGTPTIILNGRKLLGAHQERFDELVATELFNHGELN